MAAFARAHGMRLRPHAKMHKCAAIARLQIAAGAVGVCVQKTSEAEALADAGIDDIYISNEVIAPQQARPRRRAGAAASGWPSPSIRPRASIGWRRRCARPRRASTCSSRSTSARAAAARRRAAAGALAHRVVSHAPPEGGLRFAGLQAYHGGAQHRRGAAEREAASQHAAAQARAAQASITASGIACPLVTGGGTGTFAFDAASGVWGELQCGSYLFMDRDYADNEPDPHAPRFEQALFVKSRVMSRGASHAVIDAGHKSHAVDSGLPAVHAAAARLRERRRRARHPAAAARRRGAGAAGARRHGLAGSGSLRPDGQPARPPDRCARRPRDRGCRSDLAGRRARRPSLAPTPPPAGDLRRRRVNIHARERQDSVFRREAALYACP